MNRHAVQRLVRRDLVWLAVIVLIGVLLRLWMIWITPLDPRFSNADDGDSYRRALQMAVTGEYIDDFWLIRPPLQVWFYAAWLKIALVLGILQSGVLLIQLAQVVVAIITILVGYAIAWRLFQCRLSGLLFAAFLAFWYPFVEQPSVLYSELIYLALFCIHVWLLLRFDQTGAWTDLVLSGVALGAAALARSPALYSLAFVAIWVVVYSWQTSDQDKHFLLRDAPWRNALAIWVLIAAGCLLVVLPWTMRNYALYQTIIPIDTLGQVNLWLDLDKGSLRNEHITTLRGMPQAERAGYALARSRELLAENPFRPFEGMWSTFRHIWKAYFIEDFFVKQSFFTRPLRETAWLGLAGDAIWLIFVVAGLAGFSGGLREGLHARLFMLAWLGYSLLTVLIFHVEPRYLYPLWMLIGLYGAGTLANVGKHARSWFQQRTSHVRVEWFAWNGSWWWLPQILVVVAFLWLLLSYRDYGSIISSGMARERGYVIGESAYRQNDFRAAEQGFRDALIAQPGFVDAQVGLALALGGQGRIAEAQAVLVRGSSRRADLVYGALARDAGESEVAQEQFSRIEAIAGEDVQSWSQEWLRPPRTQQVRIGSGEDLGYIRGFLEAEQSEMGSFRWLSSTGLIVLPLREPIQPGAVIVLRMASGLPRPTTLKVSVGDSSAQLIQVQSGPWRSYRIGIPSKLEGSTQLTIKLSAPTIVPAFDLPNSNDARVLSLMVSEVRVQ